MNASSSLVDELMSQLQGAPMQQMAQQLGTDTEQTQSAVGAALPLLLGALGQNAAQPQGAADLLGALQRDHSAAAPQGLGGLGDLLGSVLGGAQGGNGGGGVGLGGGADILGHIFGGNQQRAEAGLGQRGKAEQQQESGEAGRIHGMIREERAGNYAGTAKNGEIFGTNGRCGF